MPKTTHYTRAGMGHSGWILGTISNLYGKIRQPSTTHFFIIPSLLRKFEIISRTRTVTRRSSSRSIVNHTRRWFNEGPLVHLDKHNTKVAYFSVCVINDKYFAFFSCTSLLQRKAYCGKVSTQSGTSRLQGEMLGRNP